jgi:hypothetical protein
MVVTCSFGTRHADVTWSSRRRYVVVTLEGQPYTSPLHSKAGCGTAVPSTTATLVDDDTLYVYCAAGFGAGPYTVRAIRNLKSKLAPLQVVTCSRFV